MTTSPSSVEDITPDALFQVLADSTRRVLLRELQPTDSPRDVSTLVETILERHHQTTSDRQELRTELDLLHHQLPKLDESGMIEYDPRSTTVRPTPLVKEAQPHLELIDE